MPSLQVAGRGRISERGYVAVLALFNSREAAKRTVDTHAGLRAFTQDHESVLRSLLRC